MALVEGSVWSSGSNIKVWDSKNYDNLCTLRDPHQSLIRNLQWVSVSPDDSYVWSGDVDGLACIWNINVGLLTIHHNANETGT